jgi:hypothetical protein
VLNLPACIAGLTALRLAQSAAYSRSNSSDEVVRFGATVGRAASLRRFFKEAHLRAIAALVMIGYMANLSLPHAI